MQHRFVKLSLQVARDGRKWGVGAGAVTHLGPLKRIWNYIETLGQQRPGLGKQYRAYTY